MVKEVLKILIVITLLISFLFTTLYQKEDFDMYQYFHNLERWGEEYALNLQKPQTGIEVFDKILSVPPMSWIVDVVYFVNNVIQFAIYMILFISE